jgi:hypothetical protein
MNIFHVICTLGHKTGKDTQLNLYEITTPPCLIYGSETLTLRRTDERGFEGAEIRWDKEGSDEIRSEPRMRKWHKHCPKGRKIAGTSTDNSIRKNSHATAILSAEYPDPGSVPSFFCNRCCHSLYILGTDCIENTSPNSSSIVATRSFRTDSVADIASQLPHCCLLVFCCVATGVFAKPFHRNGCLYWLKSFCLEKICQIIIRIQSLRNSNNLNNFIEIN